MSFELHPKLKQDLTTMLCTEHFELMYLPNGELPWVVIIPKVPDIKEIYELPEQSQQLLYKNINIISEAINIEFACDKMNLAAFGNMVPQLHIHIIGRYATDSAWPGSVLGSSLKKDSEVQEKNYKKLKTLLQNKLL